MMMKTKSKKRIKSKMKIKIRLGTSPTLNLAPNLLPNRNLHPASSLGCRVQRGIPTFSNKAPSFNVKNSSIRATILSCAGAASASLAATGTVGAAAASVTCTGSARSPRRSHGIDRYIIQVEVGRVLPEAELQFGLAPGRGEGERIFAVAERSWIHEHRSGDVHSVDH